MDDGDDVIDDREHREREENRGENCVKEEERKYELKHEHMSHYFVRLNQGLKVVNYTRFKPNIAHYLVAAGG